MSEQWETTNLHGIETRSKDGKVSYRESEHRAKILERFYKQFPLNIEIEKMRIEIELADC
jgi:hypothetical protein